MKTLRAFWHWIDNEQPDTVEAQVMARKNLSKVALEAMTSGCSLIAARALPQCDWSTDGVMKFAFDGYRVMLRDVSLKLCEALEVVHEGIAALPVQTFVTPEVKPIAQKYFGRIAFDEQEWLPPSMQADTFRGVDRFREDNPLSGVRVPQSFKFPSYREPQCPCGTCAAARAQASKQVQSLGIDAQQYLLATHDGLVPFEPNAPSPLSAETQQALQQRNDYQQRGLELQKVDATHPRVTAYNAMQRLYGDRW